MVAALRDLDLMLLSFLNVWRQTFILINVVRFRSLDTRGVLRSKVSLISYNSLHVSALSLPVYRLRSTRIFFRGVHNLRLGFQCRNSLFCSTEIGECNVAVLVM